MRCHKSVLCTKRENGYYLKYKLLSPVNPFTPKSALIDFTLSNARRFYSSKGNPLGVKGLLRRECGIACMNLNSKTDCIMLTMLERMRVTCCVLPQGKTLKVPCIIPYQMYRLPNI